MGELVRFQPRDERFPELEGLPLVDQVDVLKETVRQLREALAPVNGIHPSWGLTKREAQVVAALVASRGDYVHKQQLYTAIYGTECEVLDKIVDVFICKARRKLAPFGVDIRTVWGQGYYLTAASKQLLAGARGRGIVVEAATVAEPIAALPEPLVVEEIAARREVIVTPSQERTVRALRAAGQSPREIAASTGLAREQVVEILGRRG